MKLKIIVFILVTFFSLNSNSSTIRVIDIDFIINNNLSFKSFLEKLKSDQLTFKKKFEETEVYLQKKLSNIDELKLILEPSELDKEINNYNEEFRIFNDNVNNFNKHYETQIIEFENMLFEKILDLLKAYSITNKIDLILTKNSYIISSNSINITNVILDELNKIDFDISFEKYK